MMKTITEYIALVALFASLSGVILAPTALVADEIRLSAKDRSNSITGCLVEYNDGLYTLETLLGVIVISDEAFHCLGTACPSRTKTLAIQTHAEVKVDLPMTCSWIGF
jgi:hypothetical protein